MEFLYEPLTTKHNKQIEEILEIYVEEDPVITELKLTENDKILYIEKILKDDIPQNLSFGIFVKETGNLIGCDINTSGKYRNSIYCEKYMKMSKNMKTLIRFEDLLEKDIDKFVGSENYFVMEIGIIKPEYQGKRLIQKLNECGIQIAVEQRFDALVSTANSKVPQKILTKTGFKQMREIYYKEYVDTTTNKKPLYNMKSKKATLMIKLIKNSKL